MTSRCWVATPEALRRAARQPVTGQVAALVGLGGTSPPGDLVLDLEHGGQGQARDGSTPNVAAKHGAGLNTVRSAGTSQTAGGPTERRTPNARRRGPAVAGPRVQPAGPQVPPLAQAMARWAKG